MNTIIFPEINLTFLLNPIAFNVGPFSVYWYGLFIVSAFIIAIILSKKFDGTYGIKFEDIITLIIIIIPISIICARAYYILFRFEYYLSNPAEIINIKNGGLAIYGGIIGAVISIIVFCKNKKIKVLDMLDFLAPLLALGQSIGRWGNFFNSEAHGVETSSIFRMGIFENQNYLEVHPTFLYESFFTLIIFIILIYFKNKRKYSGEITYMYLAMYCFIRIFIEGLRTDSLILGDFRISQLVSILFCAIGTSLLVLNKFRKKGEINEK